MLTYSSLESDAVFKSIRSDHGRKEALLQGVDQTLHPYDVLLLGGTAYYSGNAYLNQNSNLHQTLSRWKREEIKSCYRIVGEVERRGGSFVTLVEVGSTTCYEKVPLNPLLEKIGMMLSRKVSRDAAVPANKYETEMGREANACSHHLHRVGIPRKENVDDIHPSMNCRDEQQHRRFDDKASSNRCFKKLVLFLHLGIQQDSVSQGEKLPHWTITCRMPSILPSQEANSVTIP